MANQGVGNTALGAATCRLLEQYEPDAARLFDDPVVKDLVGGPIRFLMQFDGMRRFTIRQTDSMIPGIYGAQICRTRYIDDAVQAALEGGITQLVILGAGLDTRAYRLPGVERARVFEVDLPSVQAEKKKRLLARFGTLPKHVTYLPIDFERETLEDVFARSSARFDRSQPAVFVWEGVTQYIAEESVRKTLEFVGKCAPGSMLVFTYVLKSIIERRSGIRGEDKLMERLEKNHAPWLFGLEPGSVADFLRPFHLELQEDAGQEVYWERYLQPRQRNLVASEVERIAVARVVAAG